MLYNLDSRVRLIQSQRCIPLAATIAFDATLQSSWEALSVSFNAGLLNGGPTALVWGTLLCILVRQRSQRLWERWPQPRLSSAHNIDGQHFTLQNDSCHRPFGLCCKAGLPYSHGWQFAHKSASFEEPSFRDLFC